jgi:hypothetical protein
VENNTGGKVKYLPIYTLLASSLLLTGCNTVNPCAHLAAPTIEEQNVAAAKPGIIEIEQEGRNGYDCELRKEPRGPRWVWQQESESE